MTLCPRCNRNALRGGVWDAVSRTDNTTPICSSCGTQEGLEDHFEHFVTPQSDWPLT